MAEYMHWEGVTAYFFFISFISILTVRFCISLVLAGTQFAAFRFRILSIHVESIVCILLPPFFFLSFHRYLHLHVRGHWQHGNQAFRSAAFTTRA
jgi:hypothetical protein